nr:immunoglobulin heavy chain junction region [Mus musculus]
CATLYDGYYPYW